MFSHRNPGIGIDQVGSGPRVTFVLLLRLYVLKIYPGLVFKISAQREKSTHGETHIAGQTDRQIPFLYIIDLFIILYALLILSAYITVGLQFVKVLLLDLFVRIKPV